MQKSRVIMDNRNAVRWEWFGKVLQFGLDDAMQPSSFFACLSPARPGARRKIRRAPRRTLQLLLPTAAVLKCAVEVFRRLRNAASAAPPCGPGQSKCLSRGMVLARYCSSAWRVRSSPAASSLAFPPLGPWPGEKCGSPHVALCSFCPLPQSSSVKSKCSEGCGMPHKQKFRVALVS
jgi:hypothetical protein